MKTGILPRQVAALLSVLLLGAAVTNGSPPSTRPMSRATL